MMSDIQCSKWSTFVIAVMTIVCLAGCTVSSPSPGETLLPKVTPSSTASASPTSELPTPTPPAPSSTPSLTPSPSPTFYPTRTPSPTSRPTLTADEEYRYVGEMLSTNGGCELPCWWGITPGESSWQGTKEGLPGLNFQFWFPEDFIKYDLYLVLTKEKNLVKTIDIRSECFECDRFAQDWQRYSLDQLLSRYGSPSRVRVVLALPIDAGGPTYYILYMFYDDLGISVIYMGPATKQGEMLNTCFSFHQITLWLQSPELSTPLEQMIDPDEWAYTVPLDEATGMGVEEFYETFRHPGACLEAPATFP
ncbi:MAG: hypothetical protein JXR84_07990 [Anaerolineae bacterium]|nr:hypothetical protein [Anaerolineae bacterium]